MLFLLITSNQMLKYNSWFTPADKKTPGLESKPGECN